MHRDASVAPHEVREALGGFEKHPGSTLEPCCTVLAPSWAVINPVDSGSHGGTELTEFTNADRSTTEKQKETKTDYN